MFPKASQEIEINKSAPASTPTPRNIQTQTALWMNDAECDANVHREICVSTDGSIPASEESDVGLIFIERMDALQGDEGKAIRAHFSRQLLDLLVTTAVVAHANAGGPPTGQASQSLPVSPPQLPAGQPTVTEAYNPTAALPPAPGIASGGVRSEDALAYLRQVLPGRSPQELWAAVLEESERRRLIAAPPMRSQALPGTQHNQPTHPPSSAPSRPAFRIADPPVPSYQTSGKRKRAAESKTREERFLAGIDAAVLPRLFELAVPTPSVPCKWASCGQVVSTDPTALVEHLHHVHGVPRSGNISCHWAPCTGSVQMSAYSLFKHMGTDQHPAVMKGRCALCQKPVARMNLITRHLTSCAAVKAGAVERAAFFARVGIIVSEEEEVGEGPLDRKQRRT